MISKDKFKENILIKYKNRKAEKYPLYSEKFKGLNTLPSEQINALIDETYILLETELNKIYDKFKHYQTKQIKYIGGL